MVWALLLAGAHDLNGANDFTRVNEIFQKHCLDCHAAQDPEGKLVLETFDTLMEGGESGPALVPGDSEKSLLVQFIQGEVVISGKKRIMPPGRREKLSQQEIQVIKQWIDDGAPAPSEETVVAKEIVVPEIKPQVPPRNSIHAVAVSPKDKLIALGRYGEVELVTSDTRAFARKLTGHRGQVNDLVFSADGKHLFAAAGEPALFGEVRQWDVESGELVRLFEGHNDALYALALSPDEKILATGSYDQKIVLWKVAGGEELRTLNGHNGAIFDLDFHPGGKVLASASADRTVKLWDVDSGERLDTLSQSLKEVYSVLFSKNGERLYAGGVDNRIRVWAISETAEETTNPILQSRFGHEGAILNLALSSDGKYLISSAEDRTVKLWDATGELKEIRLIEAQPDWPAGLAFLSDGNGYVVGRLDGTFELYDREKGEVIPPPKPELARAEPRGLERGQESKIKLVGKNLAGLKELKVHHAGIKGELIEANAWEAWINIKTGADLALGSYEISVVGPGGESGRLKLHLDDLPQLVESEGEKQLIERLPVSFWGAFNQVGDVDETWFKAKAGQLLVFDVAGQRLGSKANVVLSIFDRGGRELARSFTFDGSMDPLLAVIIPAEGEYRVRLHDLVLGASDDHFYRVSIGELPFVTDVFPLGLPAENEATLKLLGYNLSSEQMKLKTGSSGEMQVKLDELQDETGGLPYRSRREFKVMVSEHEEIAEQEPNDTLTQAQWIPLPGGVNGRIYSPDSAESDLDLYRFKAKAGERWLIETVARQMGSPVDTKIEVLHPDGRPVERLLLRAVRDSYINFRPIDSNAQGARFENWEEMDLNQFLYMQGEVVKLFRMPQGPDSDMLFYGRNGKRITYWDTTPTAHALDEPCYIVEPHPPGTKLVSNGLPAFPLVYANDDDSERKLGTDSKLIFVAPEEGDYVIRVSDTRGASGERLIYRLILRPANPDFQLTIESRKPTVNRGSGRSFTVRTERLDGFDGEIHVQIDGMPPGWNISSPLVIEAGHDQAVGTLYAEMDADAPSEEELKEIEIWASAHIDGREVTKEIKGFEQIKLGDEPRLSVRFEPEHSAEWMNSSEEPLEITIAPGQTVPAWLHVKRNGHEDLITFTVENLPHGVIVDNIGLNGVLIPAGENEREIFLTAANWVQEMDRYCFAVENQAGRQTSHPVLLKVRNPITLQAARDVRE